MGLLPPVLSLGEPYHVHALLSRQYWSQSQKKEGYVSFPHKLISCPGITFTAHGKTWWSHVVTKLYNCLAPPYVLNSELSYTICEKSAALDVLVQVPFSFFTASLWQWFRYLTWSKLPLGKDKWGRQRARMTLAQQNTDYLQSSSLISAQRTWEKHSIIFFLFFIFPFLMTLKNKEFPDFPWRNSAVTVLIAKKFFISPT